MKFTKMHGLGNDYVYVETFSQPAPADPGELARAVSDRHFAIGSDGLILIMPSDRADARMRMFNSDGSEGEMCGNGVRCVAKFIHDHGIAARPRVTVETGRGVLTLDLTVEAGEARLVRVDMGAPILRAEEIPTNLPGDPVIDVPLEIGGKDFLLTAVSMGNPHAVLFVDDVAAFPLEALGPLIERHPAFPKRVNVHVVEVVSPSEVRMRTWERGSGVTLACGTGACAVCVAGVLTGRTGGRILAHLPGGDLELEWPDRDASVFMTGPATEVFSGTWPQA
ncbi:diaminopimelate epimerase [Planctomyces sp. SH-PL62]|uniref:diaminopimelate epimerase n=1 Tax=Planctomyces sp. SH-PL62 TaxID=1636152 RepID=UPI00078C4C68|nr:diaminopimelate epimerase [Planctomyces sp. SH-PL62]AMV37050.1 Diaminopimelate epimerase [Planctomyces sp. SH-PL62]